MNQKKVLASTHSLKQLEVYTWIVRKEKNWLGQVGYTITLKELEGCNSYGDTFQEAVRGLTEAVTLWLSKGNKKDLPLGKNGNHIILLEPEMSNEEFEKINYIVQEW